MSGFDRYAAILRLFDDDHEAWSVPAIAAALSIPVSTIYRTVRELAVEGFLDPVADAQYRLGAAFVAFDRLTRRSDPLVRVGEPVLRDMVRQAGLPCVGLLCRLFDDAVMCVADVAQGTPPFRSSYDRGRRMPLAAGATSKVILAQLPPRRLGRLTEASETLRDELSAIRRRGYTVSRGEIDRGLVGLAAPVTAGRLGSLSLVVEEAALDAGSQARLTMLLVASAAMLSEMLQPAEVYA